MLETGRLAPDSFINPSLTLDVMLPALWVQQALARAGLLAGHAADPLWLGRVLAGLAGAAGAVVLAWAAQRTHPRLGVWPGIFLAIAPGPVNLAHFATPEAWLILGTSLTLGLAVAHASGRAPSWVLGLALGLTASTKYTAAALCAPALLAVAWRKEAGDDRPASALTGSVAVLLGILGALLLLGPGTMLAGQLRLTDARLLHPASSLGFVRRLGWLGVLTGIAGLAVALSARGGQAWARRLARRDVALLAGAAAIGFLLATPHAALQPRVFLSDLAFNHQTRFEYKGLTGQSTSFLAYLGLLGDALTGPLLVAALLGLLVALGRARRGDRAAGILVLAALGPYLLVASSGHQALRFLAPALPAAAWLAALGCAALPSARARRAAFALVTLRAALGAVLVVRLFFVDSRIEAGRWLAAHVPPGDGIDAIANHAGYLPSPPPGRTLRLVPTLSREMAPPERFREAAERYATDGARWLVLTASYYERFLEHPEQRPERALFFRDLLEGRGGYTVAARFRQQGWLRPEVEFVDPEIVVLTRRE